MKKITVVLVLAILLLIGGCATPKQKEMIWVAATKQGLEQDLYQCQQDASVASGVYSTAGTRETTATRRRNYEAILGNCMGSKGYVLEDKEYFLQKKKEFEELARKRGFKVGFIVSVADNVEAKILKVSEDSPAEKAGMKTGDVIKKINGNDISSSIQLLRSDWGIKAGQPSTFVVTRDGFPKTLTLIPEKVD